LATDTRRIRPVHLGAIETTVRRVVSGFSRTSDSADDVVYLAARQPLGNYPVRITDCLDRWAREAPNRTFLAERPEVVSGFSRTSDVVSGFSRTTYADARAHVRAVAQALLARKLSVDRPILILSGNSVDHGLLALAAMYVGVPYAPIAPAYSLQANEFGTLRQVFERMQPGLVFAAEGARFERALADALPPEVE